MADNYGNCWRCWTIKKTLKKWILQNVILWLSKWKWDKQKNTNRFDNSQLVVLLFLSSNNGYNYSQLDLKKLPVSSSNLETGDDLCSPNEKCSDWPSQQLLCPTMNATMQKNALKNILYPRWQALSSPSIHYKWCQASPVRPIPLPGQSAWNIHLFHSFRRVGD